MNFFQKIGAVWQKVGLVQRALLSAIVLTFIIVGALLFHWARRPDMRMLYQDLSPEEASKITDKIIERGIAYELRNGGTSVYAPSKNIYQLRLDMAKDGLPSGGQKGYKIFDNEKIGVSPFVQGVNLKRALQDELAKSIQMIDGVGHARIHIVTSEHRLFSSDGAKTTASVILKLKPGYRLSGLNIAAITHLVSGSVEGLSAESVTVIDSQGRLLSGSGGDGVMSNGAGTVQEYRQNVEGSLSKKVEDMLATVLGPGRSTVRVSAVIDMNSTSTVTKTFNPDGKVVTKEEIMSGSETEPGMMLNDGESAVPGGTKRDETIVTEYAVAETVEQQVSLPGTIRSLTVAAFVDLWPSDANSGEAGGSTALIMEVADVEEVIRNALGLKTTDALKVINAKFPKPLETLVEEESPSWGNYIAIARQASMGIMAICALLVLRIFGGAKKKVKGGAVAGELAAAEGAVGLLPAQSSGGSAMVLRKQIASVMENNPEQARQLFSSWLAEGQEANVN